MVFVGIVVDGVVSAADEIVIAGDVVVSCGVVVVVEDMESIVAVTCILMRFRTERASSVRWLDIGLQIKSNSLVSNRR